MNDSTNTKVADETAKLLADLREMLEAGSKFVLEQAPPLAKEIVAYGRVMSLVWLVVGGLILYSIYKLAPKIQKAWGDVDDIFSALGGLMYIVAGGITSIALILTNLQDAVKAWFAPRLYLLEYISSLVK